MEQMSCVKLDGETRKKSEELTAGVAYSSTPTHECSELTNTDCGSGRSKQRANRSLILAYAATTCYRPRRRQCMGKIAVYFKYIF